MIQRIRDARAGFADYLIDGRTNKNPWTRDEKDYVTPITGNLKLFGKVEDYLINTKGYVSNYLHIVLSLSKKDEENLRASDINENRFFRSLIGDVIHHHANGYAKNEIISYAEMHIPKILYTPEGVERREHIHLGIMAYNPKTATKIKTSYSRNNYINKVFQRFINLKYGFENPRVMHPYHARDKFIQAINLMSILQLQEILNNYYANRLAQITLRRNNDFARDIDERLRQAKTIETNRHTVLENTNIANRFESISAPKREMSMLDTCVTDISENAVIIEESINEEDFVYPTLLR